MIESTTTLQTLDLYLLVVSLSFIPVFVIANYFPGLRFQVALEASLAPPTPNNPTVTTHAFTLVSMPPCPHNPHNKNGLSPPMFCWIYLLGKVTAHPGE
jgi:hypothetical protein